MKLSVKARRKILPAVAIVLCVAGCSAIHQATSHSYKVGYELSDNPSWARNAILEGGGTPSVQCRELLKVTKMSSDEHNVDDSEFLDGCMDGLKHALGDDLFNRIMKGPWPPEESSGSNAEPSTLPPSPQQASPSTYAMPAPTTVPSAPPQPTLSPDAEGNVYVQTQSGLTHCIIWDAEVACRAQFTNSPGQANIISLTRDGLSHWITKTNPLPSVPYVTLNYDQTYDAVGWSIYPSADGTRFTNDGTGHGMFVSIDNVHSF
jgi:hypothetical protein